MDGAVRYVLDLAPYAQVRIREERLAPSEAYGTGEIELAHCSESNVRNSEAGFGPDDFLAVARHVLKRIAADPVGEIFQKERFWDPARIGIGRVEIVPIGQGPTGGSAKSYDRR